MFINKNFGFKAIMNFSGGHLIWLTLWSAAVCGFIETMHAFDFEGFRVPWLPVSIVGTAVAFYVGFKNNSAYDRLWEARKIWGAIVNSSRMCGVSVKGFVTNQFRDVPITDEELHAIHKRLLYRHIAWLYALRAQLLVPTPWEHINQNKYIANRAKMIMNNYGVGAVTDGVTEATLKEHIPENEIQDMLDFQNTTTQLIDKQSQELKELREQDLIDDFRHMELQKLQNEFFVHQGKCERIKKFPLPRQYGSMSFIFVGIFIFLLPFAFVDVFHDLSDWGAWVSIPFSVIVGWVFVMMELIGDYSENPFEGLGNDIPMRSLCRVIEIDLKEMLEDQIPGPVEPVDGVLM